MNIKGSLYENLHQRKLPAIQYSNCKKGCLLFKNLFRNIWHRPSDGTHWMGVGTILCVRRWIACCHCVGLRNFHVCTVNRYKTRNVVFTHIKLVDLVTIVYTMGQPESLLTISMAAACPPNWVGMPVSPRLVKNSGNSSSCHNLRREGNTNSPTSI